MNKKIDLQAVVSEHYAAVYRFGCALTKNESDAADLTQEAFLMLAKHHSRILQLPLLDQVIIDAPAPGLSSYFSFTEGSVIS